MTTINDRLAERKARKDLKMQVFMSMAKEIAKLSRDPDTQHGCVIVDRFGRVVSCGYNGAVQGVDDQQVPKTRPEKYWYTLHAEDNAVSFAQRECANSTAYITGFPCGQCAARLMQFGVRTIVYGERESHCISPEERRAVEHMAHMKDGIELIQYIAPPDAYELSRAYKRDCPELVTLPTSTIPSSGGWSDEVVGAIGEGEG